MHWKPSFARSFMSRPYVSSLIVACERSADDAVVLLLLFAVVVTSFSEFNRMAPIVVVSVEASLL